MENFEIQVEVLKLMLGQIPENYILALGNFAASGYVITEQTNDIFAALDSWISWAKFYKKVAKIYPFNIVNVDNYESVRFSMLDFVGMKSTFDMVVKTLQSVNAWKMAIQEDCRPENFATTLVAEMREMKLCI
jgi:hypothetical protein